MGQENTKNQTMLQWWYGFKQRHPDAIILIRKGDFYEIYNEDVRPCTETLGLTPNVQSRKNNFDLTKPVVTSGFPSYKLDHYLPRLIRAGYRVAFCDYIENK